MFWKLTFCAATFLAFLLVGVILYTNLKNDHESASRSSWFDPMLNRFVVRSPDRPRKNLFLTVMLVVALAVPYSFLASPLDVVLPPVVSQDGEHDAVLVVSGDVYVMAGVAIATLVWLMLPLLLCLREVFRKHGVSTQSKPGEPEAQQKTDRWLIAESLVYRFMTLAAAVAGIVCIVARTYQFAMMRPELPNDWLALDRSAHLMGGISPIVPVSCIGAAILWWTYLELKRIHSHPLLHREADLISLRGTTLPSHFPWRRMLSSLNARFRLCVDLLEYPVTILVSKNLPLATVVLSAVVGLLVFVWGVVWPRFIPTPEGRRFDLLIVASVTCYLLLLMYSQIRYIWLWKSLLQLLRHVSLLPMAGAFDRIPPLVAAKLGRFLRASIRDDGDLELPLQQSRLLIDRGEALRESPPAVSEALRVMAAVQDSRSELERFEVASNACVRPVLELAWPRRSIEAAYGQSISGDTAPAPPVVGGADDPTITIALPGLDPATAHWLEAAEDLLAMRMIYLVSQFAGPLQSMSAQLIYGPLLLLLAVAWYPFHPLQLLTIVIWAFILGGVLATLLVLIQIERNAFVTKVARTAPNSFKLDQTFIANLLPYAVPVVGFLLTAFPSLGYWIGSLLGPIGRAVK